MDEENDIEDGMGKNDPYRLMDRDSTTPDFLDRKESGSSMARQDSARDKSASVATRALSGKSGKETLNSAEEAANGELEDQKRPDNFVNSDNRGKESEEEKKGLYSGKLADDAGGMTQKAKGLFKNMSVKKSATIVIVVVLLVGLIATIVMNLPNIIIGTIDYNLQKKLGFSGTTAILEKQAEYITKEMLSNGKVPEFFSEKLADAGIDVGQVTASGEFVKTDIYIADLDGNNSVASSGEYHNGHSGELAVLFDSEITNSENFVEVVESNLKLYAAFAAAVDNAISASYYYSGGVNETYQSMDVSRGNFNDFESTGDPEKDREAFNEILSKMLDTGTTVDMNVYGGCHTDRVMHEDVYEYETQGNCHYVRNPDPDSPNAGVLQCEPVTRQEVRRTYEDKEVCDGETVGFDAEDADSTVAKVGDETNDTERAAQLLNTAVSASEPYLAAKNFMAIEEPIQRTRIEGGPLANYVMETLSKPTEVEYYDVGKGENVKSNQSVLTTQNFTAVVSSSNFSKTEASNFALDRVQRITNMNDSDVITGTTIATDGGKKSNIVVNKGDGSTDGNTLQKAVDSINQAAAQKNSELLSSIVGGNRIVEGGAFISNTINMQNLGAAPSDEATVAAYQEEVKEVLARKSAAERATKSPFDISTPNTFLGSIVFGFGSAMVKGLGNNSAGAIVSTTSVASNALDDSVDSLLNNVLAKGEDYSDFAALSGYCNTVDNAGVKGNLYCAQDVTITTKYMSNTEEQWGDLNAEDNDDYEDYLVLGTDREATVGVKSSEVCEAYKDKHGDDSILGKFLDALTNLVSLSKSCDERDVPSDVATGKAYSISSENGNKDNIEMYSGYMLYDTVKSLLNGLESQSARIKKNYYALHPKDNSAAGRLARISGLTKHEAQIALNYASYLNMIANYNPGERYAFGVPTVIFKKTISFSNDEKINMMYIPLIKQISYADIRNRTYTV